MAPSVLLMHTTRSLRSCGQSTTWWMKESWRWRHVPSLKISQYWNSVGFYEKKSKNYSPLGTCFFSSSGHYDNWATLNPSSCSWQPEFQIAEIRVWWIIRFSRELRVNLRYHMRYHMRGSYGICKGNQLEASKTCCFLSSKTCAASFIRGRIPMHHDGAPARM